MRSKGKIKGAKQGREGEGKGEIKGGRREMKSKRGRREGGNKRGRRGEGKGQGDRNTLVTLVALTPSRSIARAIRLDLTQHLFVTCLCICLPIVFPLVSQLPLHLLVKCRFVYFHPVLIRQCHLSIWSSLRTCFLLHMFVTCNQTRLPSVFAPVRH